MPKLMFTVARTVTYTTNVVVDASGKELMYEVEEAIREEVPGSFDWEEVHTEVQVQLTDKLPKDYEGPVDLWLQEDK